MERATLDGPVTLEGALDSEDDMLVKLSLWSKQEQFLNKLYESRATIATAVGRHMNATYPPTCQTRDVDEWMVGSFNVCIPVRISAGPFRNVIMRFPLPHKIGETRFSGNVDEKLNAEAAMYAWLHTHCPDVPIPRLFGYALSHGQCRTILDCMPFMTRVYEEFRRKILRWLGRPVPCRYVEHGTSSLDMGYLLLEDIRREGTATLQSMMNKHRGDVKKRQNLLRDLARVTLAIGRVRLPRIGSLSIDKDGYVDVTSRPLISLLHRLENENVDTGIEKTRTYTDTVPYVFDLIELHSNCLRHQANSVLDEEDGLLQMAIFSSMRMMLPHFHPQDTRNGPFILRLTDLHPGNLYVDDDLHITGVVDLEHAAFLPQEMELAPYWLSHRKDLDDIIEAPEAFDTVHTEFTRILREEERIQFGGSCPRADTMQRGWDTRAFFYYHALQMRTGSVNLVQDGILPLFRPGLDLTAKFVGDVALFWSRDAKRVLAQKIEDRRRYEDRIREFFSTQ